MSTSQQKAQNKLEAPEPAGGTAGAAPEAPQPTRSNVVTPPSYDPELFRRALNPQITVSQYPASPESIRLECLKIALGRGLSTTTPDSTQALRRAVDDYYKIVTGEAGDG